MVEIRKEGAARGDRQHDQQLLRDLEIVNARTWDELGPLPLGGLPIAPRRKPVLPRREAGVVAGAQPGTASFPVSRAVDDIPTDPEGAEMFILGKLFKKKAPQEPWPIRFDSFSFDACCYNTLKCHIYYNKSEMSLHISEPSGQPISENWKESWSAGYSLGRPGFPPPVEIYWTALDGVARETEIDLEDIFPDRLVLHNVAREDVKPGWEKTPYARSADILLEVNDRTINVYMRGWIVLKERESPDDPGSDERRDLVLAWTKTY